MVYYNLVTLKVNPNDCGIETFSPPGNTHFRFGIVYFKLSTFMLGCDNALNGGRYQAVLSVNGVSNVCHAHNPSDNYMFQGDY